MKQEHDKQPMHNSRAAMGNMIHLASALAPLIIGEFVKNPETRWLWTRRVAAASAVVSAYVWRDRIKHEREPARAEAHAGRER